MALKISSQPINTFVRVFCSLEYTKVCSPVRVNLLLSNINQLKHLLFTTSLVNLSHYERLNINVNLKKKKHGHKPQIYTKKMIKYTLKTFKNYM